MNLAPEVQLLQTFARLVNRRFPHSQWYIRCDAHVKRLSDVLAAVDCRKSSRTPAWPMRLARRARRLLRSPCPHWPRGLRWPFLCAWATLQRGVRPFWPIPPILATFFDGAFRLRNRKTPPHQAKRRNLRSARKSASPAAGPLGGKSPGRHHRKGRQSGRNWPRSRKSAEKRRPTPGFRPRSARLVARLPISDHGGMPRPFARRRPTPGFRPRSARLVARLPISDHGGMPRPFARSPDPRRPTTAGCRGLSPGRPTPGFRPRSARLVAQVYAVDRSPREAMRSGRPTSVFRPRRDAAADIQSDRTSIALCARPAI